MASGERLRAVAKLRAVAEDCAAKRLWASAVFFADKVVTAGGARRRDVRLLAGALAGDNQPRRALALLRRHGLVGPDPRATLLAAQCLAAAKQWEECLAVLGDPPVGGGSGGDGGGASGAPPPLPPASEDDEDGMDDDTEDEDEDEQDDEERKRLRAATALLRGRVYEALENRARATHWYRAALQLDAFCYEAFEALVDRHMLDGNEERQLLAELPLAPADDWVRLLYQCKTKKYGEAASLKRALAALDAEPDADAAGAMDEGAGAGAAPPALPPVVRSLRGNADVIACEADGAFHQGDYERAYALTTALLEEDPFQLGCLPVHLAAAVELRHKNELFLRAHKLVEEYPTAAVAWFAVGCYYFCIRQYDAARRYFSKATALEGAFAPAWLAFGHSFAAQDESDQAMAAYRTAARLFPGCHLPVLCMGMEYQRTNNLSLAEQFFNQARSICPSDPLVYNELGVLAFRNKDYTQAEQWLRQALVELPTTLTEAWEATVVNLAHTLRKQRKYAAAVEWYEKALSLAPATASTYAAIGFTHHLMGAVGTAIEYYHKALGLRPEDAFTEEMLADALQQQCAAGLPPTLSAAPPLAEAWGTA